MVKYDLINEIKLLQFTQLAQLFCLGKFYFFTISCNKRDLPSYKKLMKKTQSSFLLGFLVLALLLVAGLIQFSSSKQFAQYKSMKSSGVVEKAEKISTGMPLWHAIPRFLFRRY
jgi:hypothetical protein